MNDDNKRRQGNWTSMIGWLVFLVALAGPAVINGINQLIGGSFTLSGNLLPIIIVGLLALSIVVTVVRTIGGAARSSGETRLPTSSNPTTRPPTTSQPPFGNTTSQPPFGNTTSRPPTAPQPPFGNTTSTMRSINTTTRYGKSQMPSPPRFEPIINPTILAFGVVGVLVLLGVAFVVLSLITP
ncbi:MAG: hypothetical protein AAGF95_28890 [Chloroflexota bacterium]